MVSQYEASTLSTERAILETRRWIDQPLTAHVSIIALVAVAALALRAAKFEPLAVPATVVSTSAVVDMPAVIEKLHASAITSARLPSETEASPPAIFFGFLEFERDPTVRAPVLGTSPSPTDRTARIETSE